MLCLAAPASLPADTPAGGAAAAPDTVVDPYSLTYTSANPPSDTVVYGESPLMYGLFVGTGPRWTAGRLSHYFSWAWDFTFGAQLSWRRVYLEGTISFASPTLRKPDLVAAGGPDLKFRANVKSANYTAIGFNLGYTVYRGDAVSITPFAGAKWTKYSWTARPLETDINGNEVMGAPQHSFSLKDFNIDFGCNIDWRFSTAIVTSGTRRQALMSSLRLTPYAIRGVYSSAVPSFNGWQLGLMIAYSATVRPLRTLIAD